MAGVYLCVCHVDIKITFVAVYMLRSLPGAGNLMMSGFSSNEQGGRVSKGEG